MRDARFFCRAIVFKVRTCSAVHARRFVVFLAIESLPVPKNHFVARSSYEQTAIFDERHVEMEWPATPKNSRSFFYKQFERRVGLPGLRSLRFAVKPSHAQPRFLLQGIVGKRGRIER
jgi:hypothetical protein